MARARLVFPPHFGHIAKSFPVCSSELRLKKVNKRIVKTIKSIQSSFFPLFFFFIFAGACSFCYFCDFFSPHLPASFHTDRRTHSLFPTLFYHQPSFAYPHPSISLHLSSSPPLPPSLPRLEIPVSLLTSAFSHLVASDGKCKLCCFKYPCLPRVYSSRCGE